MKDLYPGNIIAISPGQSWLLRQAREPGKAGANLMDRRIIRPFSLERFAPAQAGVCLINFYEDGFDEGMVLPPSWKYVEVKGGGYESWGVVGQLSSNLLASDSILWWSRCSGHLQGKAISSDHQLRAWLSLWIPLVHRRAGVITLWLVIQWSGCNWRQEEQPPSGQRFLFDLMDNGLGVQWGRG